ncbi:MAG: cysteine peptidase family C39 domain-containing protein [Patescibacteria group bacterium]
MSIKLKHHRQTPGFCGPASLKILLTHYGKDFSEEELSRLCDATFDFGTEHDGLVKAVKEIGGHCFTKEDAGIEDLNFFIKRDIPVIVGWWSEDIDHYSVVFNIDDENIYLMDPEKELEDDGAIVKMPIHEFDKLWYDFEGKNNDRKVLHWFMAVTFLSEKFDITGGSYC